MIRKKKCRNFSMRCSKFKLCCSDLAEVDFPNEFAHNDNDDESLDVDAGHDVHDARVELKPNVGG